MKSRRWIWFFLLLGILAVAGLSVEIWFNLNQQLTPEKLVEAQARWQANGPRDYTIEYEIKQDNNPDPAPRTPNRYTVHVENGHVVSATGAGGQPLPAEAVEFGSMDDLFRHVQEQMQGDRAANTGRPFVTATFDRQRRPHRPLCPQRPGDAGAARGFRAIADRRARGPALTRPFLSPVLLSFPRCVLFVFRRKQG